jgi:hypothetical protein
MDDPVRAVQRSAIQTFLHFTPSAGDLRAIRGMLASGRIQEANYYDLVSLLQKNRDAFPEPVGRCLELMVRKPLKDPGLEARIRGLLPGTKAGQ